MSESDQELFEDLENLISLYELWEKYEKCIKKHKKIKRNKNRPINKERDTNGYFKVTFLKIKELDPAQFFIHTRMPVTVFELLLSACKPYLEKKSMRKPIEPESRLALTLL